MRQDCAQKTAIKQKAMTESHAQEHWELWRRLGDLERGGKKKEGVKKVYKSYLPGGKVGQWKNFYPEGKALGKWLAKRKGIGGGGGVSTVWKGYWGNSGVRGRLKGGGRLRRIAERRHLTIQKHRASSMGIRREGESEGAINRRSLRGKGVRKKGCICLGD